MIKVKIEFDKDNALDRMDVVEIEDAIAWALTRMKIPAKIEGYNEITTPCEPFISTIFGDYNFEPFTDEELRYRLED